MVSVSTQGPIEVILGSLPEGSNTYEVKWFSKRGKSEVGPLPSPVGVFVSVRSCDSETFPVFDTSVPTVVGVIRGVSSLLGPRRSCLS